MDDYTTMVERINLWSTYKGKVQGIEEEDHILALHPTQTREPSMHMQCCFHDGVGFKGHDGMEAHEWIGF